MFQRDCLASKEKREKGADKTALKKSKRVLIKAESMHCALVERKSCWVTRGLVTEQKWSSVCKQAVVYALSFMQLFNSDFGHCLVPKVSTLMHHRFCLCFWFNPLICPTKLLNLQHSCSWSLTFMQRLAINFHEFISSKHVNVIKTHGLYS